MSRNPNDQKTRKKPRPDPVQNESVLDQARDELFSHILRCGVIDADEVHRNEWLDDTLQYLADRYTDLTEEDITRLRTLGDRFCRPIVMTNRPTEAVGAPEA